MAQKDLIPFDKRTEDEQKKIRQKGGVASGKTRRRKKAVRTVLKEAISMPLSELPPDLRDGIMKAAKVKDDTMTVGYTVLGSLIRTACNGNSQMMKLLLDTIGESADVRLKEREVRLKEREAEEGRDTGGGVQIVDDLEDDDA